jgi:hypothetical protein
MLDIGGAKEIVSESFSHIIVRKLRGIQESEFDL